MLQDSQIIERGDLIVSPTNSLVYYVIRVGIWLDGKKFVETWRSDGQIRVLSYGMFEVRFQRKDARLIKCVTK